ncbi:unnamed protein product [Closterium sp. Naga37s-1]|nr:unnamed protein product [Closterium sp. Naga37s-1]
MVGREGIAAPGEAAGEQETVEGEAAVAATAVGSGAMGTESEAAVAVEAAVAAGLEGVAAEATKMVVAAELGGPDAASGGGSASPSAIPQAWQPEEPGPPVAQERTEVVELAASPEPVTASVLAAAVTAAAGEQDGARTEEGAPIAAASAGTSAAAEGASTQGHGLGGSGRRGHGAGGIAGAARGKMKLRAQPAPRRPGAGLGLGPPGPLLGWLLQGQLPRGQERQLPSVGTSDGRREAGDRIRLAPTPIITAGNAVAGPSTQQPPRRDSRSSTGGEERTTTAAVTAQQTPRRETRSVTRAQGITWGQPRVGQATPMLAPWIPAGRPQQAGRGEQNAGPRGGETARGTRGGGRGARGGWGGRGPIVGGRVSLVRTGTLRERHERPEQAEPAMNHNEEDDVNTDEGGDYVAESAEPSEEISLEDEEEVHMTRKAGERRRTHNNGVNHQGDNPQGTGIGNEEVPGVRGNPQVVGENGDAPNEGQSDSGVKSPSDLADDSAIWELAATWDKYPLQKGDQPFVVRRMPPKILESYTLCLLAPLIRLSNNPDCPGAWAILQYFPRLTLRPAPEPVEGSRWTAIELRLHQFQLGSWQALYTDACVIPDNESPIRHQPDDAGLCARAEGLIRKGNISKAVAALRTTPLAEATAATLTALQAKHPAAETSLPGLVTGFNRSTLSVSADELREILKKCPNGVGAGPSGTCFEHLKDPALANGEVLILLAKRYREAQSVSSTPSDRY